MALIELPMGKPVAKLHGLTDNPFCPAGSTPLADDQPQNQTPRGWTRKTSLFFSSGLPSAIAAENAAPPAVRG